MKLGRSTVWHVPRAALRRRERWLYFVPCPLCIGEPSPCPYLYDLLLSAINFDDESAFGCTDGYVTTVNHTLVKLMRTLLSIFWLVKSSSCGEREHHSPIGLGVGLVASEWNMILVTP